jgi:D-xylose transport system permease protein
VTDIDMTAAPVGGAPPQQTIGKALRDRWNGIRGGDVGSLPIVLALLVIAIFFQSQNSHFDDPGNMVNLIVQMAGYATIAFGVVFVLLLGEIDLSISFVSGVCGLIAAKLVEPAGMASAWSLHTNGLVAIGVALLVGAGIGLLQGAIIVVTGVHSFVVTLAGNLFWSGALLALIGLGGDVPVQDKYINGIANNYFSHKTAVVLVAIGVVGYALSKILGYLSRRRAGVSTDAPSLVALKIGAVALVGWFLVHYTYLPGAVPRGLPYVALVLALLLAGLSYLATRTRFGRHIYAVGGNAEATRRSGISVNRVRIAGFVLGSTLAAFGGVIFASRLQSVDTGAGNGTLLLDCIAAAVIGGTSLLGGRGHPKNALFGALVITALTNGMGLLGYSAGTQSMATALILLAAVSVDALSRRKLAKS